MDVAERPLFGMLVAAVLLTVAGAVLSGCGGGGPGRAVRELAPGSYDAAFDAARDVLRARGFELSRVDARAGMIETSPARAHGVLSPWIRHSVNAEMGVRGVLHWEQRVGRVSFARGPAGIGASDRERALAWRDDLRAWEGPIVVQVEVELQRLLRPGRRVDPTSVRLTSTTVGRTSVGEQLTGEIDVVDAGFDVEFSRALADEIVSQSGG